MILCRRCGRPFEPHYRSVKFCPECREYRRLYPYDAKYRGYRRLHPEAKRVSKSEVQRRHNEESLEFAEAKGMRWGSDEDSFLRANALSMTARDIAFTLRRTYLAVTNRACKLGVPMMTEDKRHGRLVTQ